MRQKIQILLFVAMAVAAVRLAWILYDRRQSSVQQSKQEAAPLNPDYYVVPKKLYPYDLKSAKQLTVQPVWVKVGYAYPYYRFNNGTRQAGEPQEAGRLLPLQRLAIRDVVLSASSDTRGRRQILATFEEGGKSYAAPIGSENHGDYKFYSDDMLFIQDPHELYKHWPAEVWKEIDEHQVRQGMSELQTDFALGIGLLEPGSDAIDRTLNYPNGGNPLKISFHHDKAIRIAPGEKE